MRSFLEKKIIVTILSFMGLAILILIGVIWPTVRYIKELDRDTYNLRVTLERKNEKVMNYRRTSKQLDKIKAELPRLEDHIFYSGQELKLITTLEGLATKNSVTQKITNSNVDSITNNKIQASLNISGPYHKVLAYVNDLEQLPYFINIIKFSIAPLGERGAANIETANLNLDISLYVIPQN